MKTLSLSLCFLLLTTCSLSAQVPTLSAPAHQTAPPTPSVDVPPLPTTVAPLQGSVQVETAPQSLSPAMPAHSGQMDIPVPSQSSVPNPAATRSQELSPQSHAPFVSEYPTQSYSTQYYPSQSYPSQTYYSPQVQSYTVPQNQYYGSNSWGDPYSGNGVNPEGAEGIYVGPSVSGGLHVRHPYYSYRRPWYTRGPASLNVDIVW